MDQAQVEQNLDRKVLYGDQEVIIRGWLKGWVEIEFSESAENAGAIKKVRGKDLMAIPGSADDESVDTGMDADNTERTPEQEEAFRKLVPFDLDEEKVDCPKCSKSFRLKEKTENIRCPHCGAMWIVRLHPDKERYVVGLGETANGRDTMDIDDDIAGKLRGMNVDDLYSYAEKVLLTMDLN